MKDFIYDIITELLGIHVKWKNENGPKIEKPFANLILSSSSSKGMDQKKALDGKVNITGSREAVLEVEYYGENAVAALEDLVQKMQADSVANRCFKQSIIFFDSGEVLDITELLDSNKYEERAIVEFRIRYTKQYVDDPGYFEDVEIQELEESNP